MQKLGVLRESGHEHFNGAVVIPILDREGACWDVRAKDYAEPPRRHTLALVSARTASWRVERRAALVASKEIILCEALIDAAPPSARGRPTRHVTASYGVNGFTEDHQAAFGSTGLVKCSSLTTATRRGKRRQATPAEELLGMGIDCYRVLFPKGLDANEYALKRCSRRRRAWACC